MLKANLVATRDALDKYYGDKGKYPEQLDDLVEARYLRTLPWDPITESNATWTIVAPPNGQTGNIYDLHSGSNAIGSNNIPYAQW